MIYNKHTLGGLWIMHHHDIPSALIKNNKLKAQSQSNTKTDE